MVLQSAQMHRPMPIQMVSHGQHGLPTLWLSRICNLRTHHHSPGQDAMHQGKGNRSTSTTAVQTLTMPV